MTDFTFTNEYQNEISFPLGGIGSGCIGLAGNGQLVDFELFHRPNKQTVNGLTHFAVKAEADGEVLDARILHGDIHKEYAGGVLRGYHSWGYGHGASRMTLAGMRHFRDVTFHGNFPIASVTFQDTDFPGSLTLHATNPFIPSNQKDSSLPAAFFEWELDNTTDRKITYTIAFTMKNPFSGPTGNAHIQENRYSGLFFSTRKKKSDPAYGNATILTDCPSSSYQEYWYRSDWFDDLTTFWKNFTTYGPLQNRHYTTSGTDGEMATLTGQLTLAPKTQGVLRFLFAWYVPNVCKYWDKAGASGKPYIWKHYYTSLFHSSQDAASYCMEHWDTLLSQTRLFQRTLYDSSLPPVVLDAIQGNLAILKSSTCMRLSDGSFYTFEGANTTAGSCEGSCTHVWNYAYALAFLFPELERSMRDLEYTYSVKPNGEMNFRLMLPLSDTDAFTNCCADGQLGGLIKFYRDYKLCGDTEWLMRHWPQLKKSLEFAWSKENRFKWDPEETGVLTGRQHHTLDMELFGPNAWLTGYYLGALKAGAYLARAANDPEAADHYEALYQKGSAYVETHLFNGEHYIQEIDLKDRKILRRFGQTGTYWNTETEEMKYQYQNGCEIDQVIAQWHAHLTGLGNVFDPVHVKSALRSIYRLNFRSMRELNNPCRIYALNDEKGTSVLSYAEGSYQPRIPLPYTEECMCGMEYAAACLMLMEGMEEEALQLVQAIRNRYDGKKRNPWSEIECGSSYVRSLASYAFLPAYSGFAFDLPDEWIGFHPVHPGNYFFSLDGAWGNAHLYGSQAENTADSIELLYGQLTLSGYLTDRTSVSQITLNGTELAFTTAQAKSGTLLRFTAITLTAGSTLTIR